MPRKSEKVVTELVGGVKAMHTAAHEAVGKRLADRRARLRMSSKTRKSALTRERIMDAASELMVERGSTSFQMSEVSERCRMSKGALYYYFADRDELIGAIFDDLVDDLADGIESVVAHAPSAREALRRLFAELAHRLRGGSPLALAMTHGIGRSSGAGAPEVTSRFMRATQVIATQIERAKSEGLVRPDVDSKVAAVFAEGGFIAIALGVAGGRVQLDPAISVNDLVDMTLRGIGIEGAAS